MYVAAKKRMGKKESEHIPKVSLILEGVMFSKPPIILKLF